MNKNRVVKEDFFTQISLYKIPGNRKILYEWLKTVAILDPTIYPILIIMAEYPITDIVIDNKPNARIAKEAQKEMIEDTYEKLFVEQNVVGHLMDIGLDVGIYGNAFVSPSVNISRIGKCPQCGKTHVMSEFLHLKLDIDKKLSLAERDKQKKVIFKGECPDCKYKGVLSFKDKESADKCMVKWDVSNIDIDYTEYDDYSSYYYKPSNNLKNLLVRGNAHILDTADESLLYSILAKKSLELKTVFHFRSKGKSMIWPGWALSPVLSAITSVWYINLLTRAQEAVALDFLVPLRVLYYQNADALDGKIKTSSRNFKRMLNREIKAWREDPNRILTLPFPVQQLDLLYGGRNLLLAPEIDAASSRVAMSLGFPPSILSGDMNYSGGSITLRMLANRFSTQTSLYRRYLNEFYKKYMFPKTVQENLNFGMTNFQIADDVAKMQMIVNNDLLSRQSMYEMLGVDADKEYKRRLDDMIKDIKFGIEGNNAQKYSDYAKGLYSRMADGVANPKELEMTLSDPTRQIIKFVADFIALPKKEQQRISELLANDTPEVWKAMTEVMLKNNLGNESEIFAYPANSVNADPQSSGQGNSSSNSSSSNAKVGTKSKVAGEASHGGLFNPGKVRPPKG